MFIRFLSALMVILTMSACQSTPVSAPPELDLASQDAEALLRRAAERPGTSTEVRLRILAGRVYIFQGRYHQALAALETLNIGTLAAQQSDDVARIKARAWYALAQYTRAERVLGSITRFNGEDLLLLAQTCEELKDYRCSADGYIHAAIQLDQNATPHPADLHDRIWFALSRARKAPEVFSHPVHHGWWLLQQQVRTAQTINGQIDAWRSWQQHYPKHPACLQPPRALRKLNDYRMPRVAVLLPLSGSYSVAGKAVRDGLIAAYLSENTTAKPEVRIYDTGTSPIGKLYEQALQDGADVLVGPLLKQEVDEFVRVTQFSETPRLVLNYLSIPGHKKPAADQIATTVRPGSTKQPPLFQFGVAIEDEAVSLANHMMLAGVEHLLVVHNQAKWSGRALDSYRQHWPYKITTAAFADIKDLTGAVGEAMQVTASEERKKEIANILGQQLEFLPRARKDLDGVLALTTQMEAQALVPALRFHFADALPVFATSQAARGESLAALADFEVTEMPIFSTPDKNQRILAMAFNLDRNPLGELYALGYDAYQLATWLPILNPNTQLALQGATGSLWLERGGKFRRDLSVARISRQGIRIPID